MTLHSKHSAVGQAWARQWVSAETPDWEKARRPDANIHQRCWEDNSHWQANGVSVSRNRARPFVYWSLSRQVRWLAAFWESNDHLEPKKKTEKELQSVLGARHSSPARSLKGRHAHSVDAKPPVISPYFTISLSSPPGLQIGRASCRERV